MFACQHLPTLHLCFNDMQTFIKDKATFLYIKYNLEASKSFMQHIVSFNIVSLKKVLAG